MQLKYNFGAVDLLRNKDNISGGIPVVLDGNFTQILPVVRRGCGENTVNAYIWHWNKWSLIRPLSLTQNMRVKDGELNQRFAHWLSKLSHTPSLYGSIEPLDFTLVTYDRDFFCKFLYLTRQIRTLLAFFLVKGLFFPPEMKRLTSSTIMFLI